MTGNGYCHRIGSAGASHGAYCFRLADRRRNLAVRLGLSGRNRTQVFPYLPLKSRGTNVEWQLERYVRAAQMMQQSVNPSFHRSVILADFSGREFGAQTGLELRIVITELNRTDTTAGGGYQHPAE